MSDQPPLRVLHVISGDLWAGAESQVFALVRELNLQSRVIPHVVLLNEGELAARLRAIDVPVHILDESILGPLAILRGLRRHIRTLKPAVVHSHRYKENILTSLAARFSIKPRLVATVHGRTEPFHRIDRFKMRLYQRINRACLKRWFHAVISVSGELKSELATWLPATRVHVVLNALDAKTIVVGNRRETVRGKLSLSAQQPVIGTVGRLVPVKGLEHMIRAMRYLVSELPDVHLVIVGDGPMRAELEELTQELALDSCITFTGFRTDSIDLLGAVDLLAVSSTAEGVPMVVLEAMALRTPVVATRVGGLPEILVHNESGMLVESESPRALADACLALLSNSHKRKELSDKAFARLTERLSTSRQAQLLTSLYLKLIQGDHEVSASA